MPLRRLRSLRNAQREENHKILEVHIKIHSGEKVVEGAGVPRERFIVDRQVPPAVGGDDYAVAVYVDGVAVFTESDHLADSKLAMIKTKLKEAHLDTSEGADDGCWT